MKDKKNFLSHAEFISKSNSKNGEIISPQSSSSREVATYCHYELVLKSKETISPRGDIKPERDNKEDLNNEVQEIPSPVCKADILSKGEVEKKSAFTLAEIIITLTILGILAIIIIPNLIKNYTDSVNRVKYKKAWSIYEKVMQTIIIENGIKNETQLVEWADSSDKNDCANTSSYFKYMKKIDNTNCKFMTSDKVYWDISNIKKPIISLKEEKLTAQSATDENDNDAFYLFAFFNKENNALINDIKLAKSASDKSDLNDLLYYLKILSKKIKYELSCDAKKTTCYEYEYENGKKSKVTISTCNENGNCKVAKAYTYDENGKETTDSNCNTRYCWTFISENGVRTKYFQYDLDGKLTNVAKYEYENGKKSKDTVYACNENGNCKIDYVIGYDEKGNHTLESKCNTSYCWSFVFENGLRTESFQYDLDGKLTNIAKYEYENGKKSKETVSACNENGNCKVSYVFTYDENGKYKTDSNCNTSYCWTNVFENGIKTQYIKYDINGQTSDSNNTIKWGDGASRENYNTEFPLWGDGASREDYILEL